MLTNIHTHTTFCDGRDTPERCVLSAIDRGFDVLGFSSHAYTPYDLRYCMQDLEGYVAEITALKEKYRDKIEIYLGIEEDSHALVDRGRFDYIIGSCHYFYKDGVYYPIDSTPAHFEACLELFNRDYLALAEAYYSHFCRYIVSREPDVIGHFDIITKYDEQRGGEMLDDHRYRAIAEHYIGMVAEGRIFEVNSGAMSRGVRRSPYPADFLLKCIKKHGGEVLLSSDAHSADTLDFAFDDMKALVRECGFEFVRVYKDHEFIKERI